jgi:hypothetical protein
MRINTVIPCVNYDDFLSLTLPRNLPGLESVTILTAPWDQATIDLAKHLGANLLVTDQWLQGGEFNKARALNLWIETIEDRWNSGWFMVLDADVVLPADRCLVTCGLNPDVLYSAHRHMCEDEASWIDFANGKRPIRSFPLNLPEVINGQVWGHRPTSNAAAISGYMQLWCSTKCGGMNRFPESRTAAGYDVNFALSFQEHNRDFIPGFDVLHIGPSKVNWAGRKSSRWIA